MEGKRTGDRMKNSRKQNDFRLVATLPKEVGKVLAMCQFERIVLIAGTDSLFAAGEPSAVDQFVKNFAIRGPLTDPNAVGLRSGDEQAPSDGKVKP
jgi:hypothetical protein